MSSGWTFPIAEIPIRTDPKKSASSHAPRRASGRTATTLAPSRIADQMKPAIGSGRNVNGTVSHANHGE